LPETDYCFFGAIIIPYGVNPEPHELETAKFFNKLGKDVMFIAPVYEKGAKTPDIQRTDFCGK
jgi:hypothetical protein